MRLTHAVFAMAGTLLAACVPTSVDTTRFEPTPPRFAAVNPTKIIPVNVDNFGTLGVAELYLFGEGATGPHPNVLGAQVLASNERRNFQVEVVCGAPASIKVVYVDGSVYETLLPAPAGATRNIDVCETRDFDLID